ncbi:hypothetical protein SDJN02_23555, partial [Cucurbita argyrosperma subsp. argyrosperma]
MKLCSMSSILILAFANAYPPIEKNDWLPIAPFGTDIQFKRPNQLPLDANTTMRSLPSREDRYFKTGMSVIEAARSLRQCYENQVWLQETGEAGLKTSAQGNPEDEFHTNTKQNCSAPQKAEQAESLKNKKNSNISPKNQIPLLIFPLNVKG